MYTTFNNSYELYQATIFLSYLSDVFYLLWFFLKLFWSFSWAITFGQTVYSRKIGFIWFVLIGLLLLWASFKDHWFDAFNFYMIDSDWILLASAFAQVLTDVWIDQYKGSNFKTIFQSKSKSLKWSFKVAMDKLFLVLINLNGLF